MIYFDHNATTPVNREVRELVNNAMEKYWGNPSSIHTIGKEAAKELDRARETIAGLLAVTPQEIHFTSGGTEADNLAILGILQPNQPSTIVTSNIEHPAVKKAVEVILTKQSNCKCQVIPVTDQGKLQVDKLKDVVFAGNGLISVMFANNEIGTKQPVQEIGAVAKYHQIPYHSDAVQAFGKMPLNIKENNISLLAISSHKIYGPKGCGAIYIKKGTPMHPRTFGGSQEHGIRTGTQNVPAIIGFAKAAEIAFSRMEQERLELLDLTEFLFQELSRSIDNVLRNGHPHDRIPGTLNCSFPGTISGMVVQEMSRRGVCLAGGAACSATSAEPSTTLTAIGRRKIEALAGIRFSLGRSNTKNDITRVVPILKEVIENLRNENS